MKNITHYVLIGVVVVGIILLLGFVNTIVSAVVPMAIVAVIAFILGRMSVNVNFFSLILNRVRAISTAQGSAAKVAQTEQAATHAASMSQRRAVERLADKPAESKPESQEEAALDSVIKTEDQLRAESKRIEEAVARRTADYDPKTAIEERKKRLLGKTDQS